MNLWRGHQAGDAEALQTLLSYNENDINGLIAIKRRSKVSCRRATSRFALALTLRLLVRHLEHALAYACWSGRIRQLRCLLTCGIEVMAAWSSS